MRRSVVRAVSGAFAASALVLGTPAVRAAAGSRPTATAVFAGGCFWGVEAVFRHVRGVKSATSGFAFPASPASGGEPSMSGSSYAEAVRVQYDPTQVTYQQLVEIFFLVAHDPTEVDRQGPDIGPQYRSMAFVSDTGERRIVQSVIDQLVATKAYARPIVTQLAELRRFREAGSEQQNYVANHPDEPYVIINDAPKVVELRRRYADLYRN